MIVIPHNKTAETRLSTTEEFKSSSSPKKRIRKLMIAKETEYRRSIIMFLKFLRIGLSCIYLSD